MREILSKGRRVLYVNVSKDLEMTFPDNVEVVESEDELSSSSNLPYIPMATTIPSYLRNQDVYDSIMTIGLRVNSLKLIKHIYFRSENLIYFGFTTKMTSKQLSFFEEGYKGVLTWMDYLEIMNARMNEPDMGLGFNIYYYEFYDKEDAYVIIEKN